MSYEDGEGWPHDWGNIFPNIKKTIELKEKILRLSSGKIKKTTFLSKRFMSIPNLFDKNYFIFLKDEESVNLWLADKKESEKKEPLFPDDDDGAVAMTHLHETQFDPNIFYFKPYKELIQIEGYKVPHSLSFGHIECFPMQVTKLKDNDGRKIIVPKADYGDSREIPPYEDGFKDSNPWYIDGDFEDLTVLPVTPIGYRSVIMEHMYKKIIEHSLKLRRLNALGAPGIIVFTELSKMKLYLNRIFEDSKYTEFLNDSDLF